MVTCDYCHQQMDEGNTYEYPDGTQVRLCEACAEHCGFCIGCGAWHVTDDSQYDRYTCEKCSSLTDIEYDQLMYGKLFGKKDQ